VFDLEKEQYKVVLLHTRGSVHTEAFSLSRPVILEEPDNGVWGQLREGHRRIKMFGRVTPTGFLDDLLVRLPHPSSYWSSDGEHES